MQPGYVDPNLDDAAFTSGRVALVWGGHWNYARYHKALGEDLVLLPLPNFGRHTVTVEGSWMWGITTRCLHPRASAAFLRFLLRSAQVNAMAQAKEPMKKSPVLRVDTPNWSETRMSKQMTLGTTGFEKYTKTTRPRGTASCRGRRFRHRLERHNLDMKIFQQVHRHLETHGIHVGTGTIVEATLISAPSSTKDQKRDPDMCQTKRGNPQ